MNAAIISNGPSARFFEQPSLYDVVIGVNKTAAIFLLDYWVFYDANTFDTIESIGTPKLAIAHDVPRLLRELYQQSVEKFENWPREKFFFDKEVVIPNWPRDADNWCAYSGLAALGVAYHLGAKQITVFGADMNGDRDCKDYTNEASRSNSRWARERMLWNMLVVRIEAQGVQIRRVLKGEVCT